MALRLELVVSSDSFRTFVLLNGTNAQLHSALCSNNLQTILKHTSFYESDSHVCGAFVRFLKGVVKGRQ